MKKVLVLSFILLSLCSFGKSKQVIKQNQININGFGWLKLGLPIDSVVDSKPKPIDYDYYLDNVYENTTSTIWYVGTTDQSDIIKSITGSYIQDVKIYYIGKLNITNDIDLVNVKLSFYKGCLYEIQTGECVNELLTIKYGKPLIKSKETPHTYQNGYGNKFIKTDLYTSYTWITNKNIGLECVNNYYYGNDGKINHYEYTVITNKNIDNVVSKLVDSFNEKIDNEEKTRLKNKVSNF